MQTMGLLSSNTDFLFKNFGTVEGSSGVFLGLFGSLGNTFENSGIVRANDYDDAAQNFRFNNGVFTEGANTTIINGVNGLIEAIGSEGAGIRVGSSFGNANGSIVTNAGKVTSFNFWGVDFSKLAATNNATFTNTGTVTGKLGSYIGNDAGNRVTNSGVMNGNVSLGAGADVYDGRGGTVKGSILGGAGSDTYKVNKTSDKIVELSGTGSGSDTVESSVSYTLGTNVEKLLLTGFSAINGTGNSSANTITGNAAANTLKGGVDTKVDTLIGKGGNDIYVLGASTNDVVVDSSGTDTITSSIDRSLAGFTTIEKLVLTGSDAIDGNGNALANTITGNAAANTLKGGSGKDVLAGGLGKDILTGGSDADFFLFNTKPGSSNRDTITDFSTAADTIQLENSIFTAFGAATGTIASSAFKNLNLGAADSSDRILYNDSTGAVFYDRDGSGSTYSAIQIATITGAPTLTRSDFVLV